MTPETFPGEPLVISARAWAQRHGPAFSRVITLEDPEQPADRQVRFGRRPAPRHLVLTFVDLDRPPPPAYAGLPCFRMADRADVERALAFGRAAPRDRILVHCNAGIGRSTGIALALLADRLGPGREGEALTEMLRLRPHAVPNLHVVELADGILGRDGALLAAVRAWDAATPANARHRSYNRMAHFVFDGLTLGPDD